MSVVAIIPARGGSKRIPRKNVRLFAGLPIIAYSVRAAQQSRLFDRIIVSTDDDEIMRVAVDYGAEAPFRRPSDLSDDFSGTDAVMQHSLRWLDEQRRAPEYFCCIYPTAPFLQPLYLQRGLEQLQRHQATTAFAVTTFAYTIFRALKVNERGRVEMLWPENFSKRSQDLPEAFHDAGQFYWASTSKYLEARRLISDDSVPVLIPRYLVQDIDTPEDWDVAERMFKALHA